MELSHAAAQAMAGNMVSVTSQFLDVDYLFLESFDIAVPELGTSFVALHRFQSTELELGVPVDVTT
jgi:hypothetical protein